MSLVRSSVSFSNSDTAGYNISTSMGTCDSQALLHEEDDNSNTYETITGHLTNIIQRHFLLFVLVCDVFCVIIFTLFLVSKNALLCDNKDDILEWCEPFTPVNKVIVDLNFDLLVHCDMPRPCVAYAELLAAKKGFNTNFIIGDEDLVYVGKGYQCKSDVLRFQMLVTRYTWNPEVPVFKIPEEVVVRYSEIIYEGLRCGFIRSNYTVSVTCSVYGDWCQADNIRDHIPWHSPRPMALFHEDRLWWRERPHGNHPFLAFDIDRVYSRYQKLQACDDTVPDTEA